MSASERHSGRWDPTTGTNCASASNPLELAEDWPAGRHGRRYRTGKLSPPAKELAARSSYFDLILAAAEHIYPTVPRARHFRSAATRLRCPPASLSRQAARLTQHSSIKFHDPPSGKIAQCGADVAPHEYNGQERLRTRRSPANP